MITKYDEYTQENKSINYNVCNENQEINKYIINPILKPKKEFNPKPNIKIFQLINMHEIIIKMKLTE